MLDPRRVGNFKDLTTKMTKRVLLTGATGALGRALLPELLEQGYEVVCLIRPQKGLSAEARLVELTDHPAAHALLGDITLPLCGIDPARLTGIDKIVHSAADTSLDQGSEARVINSNISGTRHCLELAEALGNPEFHYVGTAYIAGDAPTLGEQQPDAPLAVGIARNPYEASKVKAEELVRAYHGQFSVQRPSIVVGRGDGRAAPRLEGLQGFVRRIYALKTSIHGGGYKDEDGAVINATYKLKLAIGIDDADDVSLNLIQLDWLARTQAALIGLPARGRTYNLTHPQSMHVRDLLTAVMEALELNYVTIVRDAPGWTLSPIKLAIRRLVKRELTHLKPYLMHSPQFESRNLYADLGPGWPEPAAITPAFIRATLRADG